MNQNYETGEVEPAGSIVRQSFGGIESRAQAEVAAIAMAEHAKASIEARCILAERHPRSWRDVEQRLLLECDRPGFAAAARYRKPVGRKLNKETDQWEQAYVEGFSIRFAEAALRYMRNVYGESTVIYEDERQRMARVTVMDLETNATIATDVVVPKTVEKRNLRRGQRTISSRLNSEGQQVHLVEATDDEVTTKQLALVSKALRNGVMRLLPGDIQDSCEDRCAATILKHDAADPMAASRKLFDAFAKLGVMPSSIAEYIGREPNELEPTELAELRGIYQAIKDGELTWANALEAKTGTAKGDDDAQKKAAATQELIKKASAKVQEKRSKPTGETVPTDKETKEPAAAAEPGATT